MPYKKVLKELRNRAQKAYDQSDFQTWVEIGTRADEFETWLEKGQLGDCPVDLTEFDLESTVNDGEPDAMEPVQEKNVDGNGPVNSEHPVLEVDETPVSSDVVSDSFDEELVEEKVDPDTDFAPDQPESVLEESEDKADDDTLQLDSSQSHQDTKLYERLKDAQELFDRGEWRQALNLCAEIKSYAQDLELKERVDLLKANIQAGMNKALTDTLELADLASKDGDDQLARSSYTDALKIDPENGHAKNGLSRLDDIQNGIILSQHEQDRLSAQLKEEKDIVALGKAVYKGEPWRDEGKLPPMLADLLLEARERFDALRTQMGKETTLAIIDDLGSVKEAWELGKVRLDGKFPYIYDIKTGKDVKTEVYVNSVEELWAEKSRITAQRELTIMEGSLPEHPKAALKHLEQVLAKPFHEDSLRVLQKKKTEVEKLEKYLISYQQPLLEKDPLKSLLSFSPPAVESDFPYFTKLQNKKQNIYDRIYSRAVAALERTVQDYFDKVDIYFGRDTHEGYKSAREEIEQAHKALDRWTLENVPDELSQKRKRADRLKEKINAREALFDELHQKINAIRALVKDPANRKAGKKDFDELKADNRFANFSAMASFISEMDQYLDAGEQLVNAKLAKQKGDWLRVFEVTERLISEGGMSAFKDEINALHEQAGFELDFSRANQFLDGNSIIEAREILLGLKLRSAKLKDNESLHERLQDKLTWVQQCEDNSLQMEQRFSQAVKLIHFSGSSILKTYLDHSLEKGSLATLSDWDRKDQDDLRKELGKNVNDPITILEAIEGSRTLLLVKLAGFKVEDKVNAMRIFQMIQGSVVMDSDEPWTVSLRTRDAGKMVLLLKESLRDYDLENLLSAYQQMDNTETLQDERLYDLSSDASLLRAAHLLEKDSERKVARWFEIEEVRRRVRSWKIRGDWHAVQDAWAKLRLNHSGHPEVEPGWLEAKMKVDAIEKVLQEFKNAPSDIVKLKILKDASSADITRDEPKILSSLHQKFVEVSDDLIQKYQTEIKEGTEESVSRALIALKDLEAAEAICEVAEDEKKYNELYIELEDRVGRAHPNLARQLPYLHELYLVLGRAADPELWKKAVLSGNFKKLNEILTNIANQDLGHLIIAQDFKNRVDEWSEVQNSLAGDIRKLRTMFEAEEDFAGIIKLIDKNHDRPETRSNGMAWQSLKSGEYSDIRNWMGALLQVTDAYPNLDKDDTSIDWSPLKTIVKQREIEYQQWKSWHAEMLLMGQEINKEYREFENQTLHPRLAGQQEFFERICRNTIALIEYIDAIPQNENEDVPVRSAKVETLQLDGIKKRRDAMAWLAGYGQKLAQVNQQIIGLNGFPGPKEFRDAARQVAQKNCAMLEMVLTRAEKIGPGNSMLMDMELKNAVAAARNKQLTDLKVLLGFLGIMDNTFNLSSDEFETQLQQGTHEELYQRLENFSVYKVFSDAVQVAQSGHLDLFKHYFEFAETVHMKRRQEEQNRIQTYKNTLKSCHDAPLTFWERIANYFRKG
jgi:hypothetical protein